MILTWGEFKRKVDAEINESGRDDSIEIQFIDVTEIDDDISMDLTEFGLEIISYREE